MIFTDDDLERWKNLKATSPHPTWKELNAIIARLEAAEKAILAMIELDDFIAIGSSSDLDGHNNMVDKAKTAMETWRKAAGK